MLLNVDKTNNNNNNMITGTYITYYKILALKTQNIS